MKRMWALLVVPAVLLVACGSGDSSGTGSDTTAAPGTSSASGESGGDTGIEVPEVPGGEIPLDNRVPAEVGQALDMPPLTVTIDDIRVGSSTPAPAGEVIGEADTAGTVLLDVSAVNQLDSIVTAPDVFVYCPDEDSVGYLADESEFVSLANMEPLETVSSTAEADMPEACADPLLVVSVNGIGSRIVEIPIPSEALP